MMQGDAYSVPVTITAQDGTVITPDMVTCVEITIGNLSRKYPGAVTFDEDTGAWQFPLTQQQTFRLQQGKHETQARVVFASGDVFGGRGDTVFVTESLSKGVLPQPEKETAGSVAPNISQVRLGSAAKIRTTVGTAKVILTSSLPPISDATKGQYLTNDGTEASWANVDALPAMFSDTAGKMLTNDGKNPEWGGAVRYDVTQTLTDANRRLGRSNIDAVTVMHNVSNESQLPDIMWDMEQLCAIELTPISNFAQLVNALTTAGLSNLDNNVYGYLQYMTSIPLSDNNEVTHVFQLFTTANEQALVTVSQSIYGSHDIRSWKATKTADWAQFFVNINSSMASGYTADKTYSEILAANRSGKTVVARFLDSGLLLPLSSDKYVVQFRGLDPWSNAIVTAVMRRDNSIVYTRTPITDENAVHVTEQTLTADQQAQARENIGFTPVVKTDDMTQSVGYDAETGGLYTTPAAGGGSDLSLGITGAQVGQIAKITAVDDSGVPTAWSPVDMPSSGSGESWETIDIITLSDAVNTVTINQDSSGNAINLKKVRLLIEGSATSAQDLFLNNARYFRWAVVGTSTSVGALSAEPFCGKMYCWSVPNIIANYGVISQQANTFSAEITITEIKLIVTNSGTFSTGTKFTIQGVRA